MQRRPADADPLVSGWREQIDAALSSVVRPGEPVALVNFPNHGNPGDPAIWLGALAALRRLECPVAYACTPRSFSATALRQALPDGPVLINGGGNFGDLYGPQQQLRERLLVELPERRLVQLPQSIHFQHEDTLARMQRLVAAHGDVVLMVREDSSAGLAASFDAPAVLCPDLALSLGPLAPTGARHPVTALLRSRDSPESVDHGSLSDDPDLHRVDWLADVVGDQRHWRGSLQSLLQVNAGLSQEPQPDPHLAAALAATFEPLAEAWVERGLAILSSGRVVVTDTLHGHLLSLLLGRPHVVLDNSYGKCRSTVRTWTGSHPLVHWADTLEQATGLARTLLEPPAG